MSFLASPSLSLSPLASSSPCLSAPASPNTPRKPRHHHHAYNAPHGSPDDPNLHTVRSAAVIFSGVVMALTAIFGIVEYSARDTRETLVRFESKLDRLTETMNRVSATVEIHGRRLDSLEARNRVDARVEARAEGRAEQR